MSTDPPPPPAALPTYVTEPLERQDLAELEAVRDYVDDLLAYHRSTDPQPPERDDLADEGEEVVDIDESESEGKDETIVVKKVPCGKDCDGCPHGPYVYAVRRQDDTVTWDYRGKYEPA